VQQRNSSVALRNTLMYHLDMTSAQFKRWLEKQGCTFEPAKGGYLTVFFGKQASILPMHGSNKKSARAWNVASRRISD
jgi:mRNA interferase HicA